jgi:mRNA export factor
VLGAKVFSGGADKYIRMMDVNTGQTMPFLAHDAPIKCCKWMEGPTPALITGSWDKTLKV